MSEETWTSEDEAKWQAAQPIIRKRARLYMKQRRDSGRVRKYSRSERKSSILRNKEIRRNESSKIQLANYGLKYLGSGGNFRNK